MNRVGPAALQHFPRLVPNLHHQRRSPQGMDEGAPETQRAHQLSPSAWNRYETCPRMYWLSRQRLPRKAGMAASLGTAVHASIEDLLNMDLAGRDDGKPVGFRFRPSVFSKHDGTRKRRSSWPRLGDLIGRMQNGAKPRNNRGGIVLLLDHIGAKHLNHEQVTIALWRHLQSLTIAVEGELKTSDGRLMGRLDLLLPTWTMRVKCKVGWWLT